MATYGISIRSFETLSVVIKSLRRYSSLPIGELKEKISNGGIIELFDSFDFSLEREFREHQKEIESKMLELAGAALDLQFHYRASKDFEWEDIDLAMMSNLIESSIQSYYQEHD